MRFLLTAAAVAVAVCLARAKVQEPEPAPSPAAPATTGKKVLTNNGKPMKLDVSCGASDIERFGLTCSVDEPCPLYLELAAVEAAGDRIFSAGNLHTEKATLYSVLLSSEDGGKTWTEPQERLPGASLDQIQFIDLEAGWVSGQLAGSLPRDPFFLITSNGGKTWARRPLFEETRVGTVDQFWFESRTAGAMTVDRTQTGDSGGRHELYESMTGGESWMLRQVSTKPIPLKKGRPAGPGTWRARADGASKSFRIEKRDTAQWTPVASFLITAGECKPSETVLTEPEPETPAKTEPEASGVFRLPGAPADDAPKKPAKKKR